jgi:hypothetical protein
MDFKAFAETTAYRQVAQTITALSTQDERIADEFRLIERGRISKGKIVEIDGDVPLAMKMTLGDFARAISTRVWESVGRANWRPFDEARAHVRALKLKSMVDWVQYYKSADRPPDIPTNPDRVYDSDGWISYGDWFGTGNVAPQLRVYRAFKKARAHTRGLGLKSQPQWRAYCKSVEKPDDIPANPHLVYADAGWIGYGDWLGTHTPLRLHYGYIGLLRKRALTCGALASNLILSGWPTARQAKNPRTFRLTPTVFTSIRAGSVGAIGSVLGGSLVGIDHFAPSKRHEKTREVGASKAARSGPLSVAQGNCHPIFLLLHGRPTKIRVG